MNKFKNKKKLFAIFLIMAFTALYFSGCSPLINDPDEEDDAPIFPGDTSEVQAKEYMLYFQLEGENYITPEIRTLTIPESRSVEETLIKELIAGPKNNYSTITANINEDTRIISVTSKEDVLFVSLSDDFLTPPAGLGEGIEDETEYQALVLNTRKMALYSIANTVTETGNYSYVQIYIDTYNTGTGTRPTRKEMGFTGEDENQLMEPLYRNTDVIFSPTASVQTIMNSVIEKNWAKVLEFTSLSDNVDLTADGVSRQFELSDLSLLEYSIENCTVSLNGKSAVIVITYSYASTGGASVTKENVSIKMQIENGIWKCSITSLNQILLGEYS